jgi:arylsulfatase A-like enzyme
MRLARLAAAVLCLACTASRAASRERPNFVIFYTDDQGWADTSVRMMKDRADSASDFHRTPHLERLAREGLVFSNAYSPAPTCTPSRISIQYGKTTARIGQTVVHDVLAKKRGINCAEERSLAHVIKAADPRYVTAHFGKGMAIRRMDASGYDITDEDEPGDSGNGNFHGDWVGVKDKRPLPADDPKRIFSLTRKATAFIRDRAGDRRPFFMMVSHYAVHVHHAALASTIEKYRALPRGAACGDRDYAPPEEMPKGYRIGSWALQYAAMIENLDTSLGSIMDALDHAGIAGDTYVVFTSDNGGGFRRSNGPLSGGKARLLEGGLRVPTVVRGPGVLRGEHCDVPVVQWDLLPTLHDLCGSREPLPADVDGGSWRAVLERGNEGEVRRPNPFLVFHYPYYAGAPVSAIRMGDYKFLRQLQTGETRLHDVARDLGEKRNLVDEMPGKARGLASLLDGYLREVDAEKLEDMYAARFAELAEYRRRLLEVEVPKCEARLRKARDPREIAKLKAQLADLRGPRLERLDRQIRNTHENRRKTGWE